MDFWESFWEFFWFLFWLYAFVAFFYVLFAWVGVYLAGRWHRLTFDPATIDRFHDRFAALLAVNMIGALFLVHAAAGGTGQILTQWAYALGARVIGLDLLDGGLCVGRRDGRRGGDARGGRAGGRDQRAGRRRGAVAVPAAALHGHGDL